VFSAIHSLIMSTHVGWEGAALAAVDFLAVDLVAEAFLVVDMFSDAGEVALMFEDATDQEDEAR